MLDLLVATLPEVTVDARFRKLRERLAGFAGIAPRGEPTGFAGTLRPYQREGLGWLHFLREFGFGGCLADDMGLGKTVQVLARCWRVAASSSPAACARGGAQSAGVQLGSRSARFAPGIRVHRLRRARRERARAQRRPTPT